MRGQVDVKGSPSHVKRGLLGIAGVVLAGLVVRVFALSEQSIWYDEWMSLVYPFDVTFVEHMTRVRMNNPDHVPLFFALEYYWASLFPASVYAQRLFSVVLSVACIPIIYGMALMVAPRGALLAASLFALSPYHLFLGQAIRPYALLTLFSLVATWLLMVYISSRKHRWIPIALAILYSAMVYTHLSSLLLVGAHLCAVAIVDLNTRRIPWLSIGFVAFLAPLVYGAFHFIESVGSIKEQSFLLPTSIGIAKFLLSFDVLGWNTELAPADFYYPGPLAPMTSRLHWLGGCILGLIFLTVYIVSLVRVVDRLLRARVTNQPMLSASALLLASTILPMLGVLAVTFLITPLLLPRFAVASTAIAYVLLVWCMESIPRAAFRNVAIVLVVFYGLQATVTMATPLRTEWKPVAGLISKRWRDGDLLVCRAHRNHFYQVNRGIIGLYLPEYIQPARAGGNMLGIWHAINYLRIPENEDARVWFLLGRYYTPSDLSHFEEIMRECGLKVQRMEFKAMERLTLFKIRRDPKRLLRDLREIAMERTRAEDYKDLLDALGTIPGSELRRRTQAALAIAYDLKPPSPPDSQDTAADIAARLSSVSLNLARALLDVVDPNDTNAGACLHEATLALAAGDMEHGLILIQNFQEKHAPLWESDLGSLDPGTRLLLTIIRDMNRENCEDLEVDIESLEDLRLMPGPCLGWNRDSAIIEAVEKLCEIGLPDRPVN